jgi:hypothetical protein
MHLCSKMVELPGTPMFYRNYSSSLWTNHIISLFGLCPHSYISWLIELKKLVHYSTPLPKGAGIFIELAPVSNDSDINTIT